MKRPVVIVTRIRSGRDSWRAHVSRDCRPRGTRRARSGARHRGYSGAMSTRRPRVARHNYVLLSSVVLALALGGLAACGDSDSSSSSGPPPSPPGEACHVRQTETPLACEASASLCYAAGTSSSCPNGALCVGDSKGMSCAPLCTQDSDCASSGAGLICMQGCQTRIMNGFCVEPGTRSRFLGTICLDGSSTTTAASGEFY